MANEIHPNRDTGKNPIEIASSDGDIILRQFTPQDAEEIFALIDKNRVFLSQNDEPTAAKYPTLKSVKESIEHSENPDRLRFAIRNKEGTYVGSINLTPDEKDPAQAEIGSYLGEEFQGRGYAGRAHEVLANYGFDFLDYETIYGDIAQTNTRSIKMVERLGWKMIGKNDGKIRYSKQK